jgi:signal transduction histidine kinase
LDGVTIGCTVEVDGTYITETDIWYPSCVFPHVRDIIIAVRTPKDVRITAYPPWWTPQRLFMLIGALLAVIFGVFAWNVTLRRRAELRGKELADEQIAHVSSELKVYERTRLAVELHDSLSQTLTGISMGIDSALDIAGDATPGLKQRLMLTSKTVEACRKELRNCLWDLRSQALEENDMNDAIQLALGQIVSKKTLSIRFNVPRTRLSDNTTHTILRIIRELAANAVRHGHAAAIKIAGNIEGDKLRFSVRDDGCGFDPEHVPGIDDGHFGLQGIRERIDHLEGEMSIDSEPGRGTKVTVAFNIPLEKLEGEDIDG